MKTLLVIPTYNELAALPELLLAIDGLGLGADILFVDDNSPDGTAEFIKECQLTRPDIHLLARAGKLGLGTAYLDGFRWALERGYEAIVQMDADLSHDPKHLHDMLASLQPGHLVIGSRYVRGGGVENWPIWRQIISKGGSFYARNVLALPISDLTGGFNAWHHESLKAIDLDNIKSNGYSFQIEMKHQAHLSGVKIIESPIVFRERRNGQSKMSKKIFIEAMWRVWLMMLGTERGQTFSKFIRFVLIGFIGLGIDLGTTVLTKEILHWNLYLANSLGFVLAVSNSFLMNRKWTFKSQSQEIFEQYVKFWAISLVGLGINSILLYLLVDKIGIWYVWAKLPITVVVAFWNFSGNHYWTFKEEKSLLVENSE